MSNRFRLSFHFPGLLCSQSITPPLFSRPLPLPLSLSRSPTCGACVAPRRCPHHLSPFAPCSQSRRRHWQSSTSPVPPTTYSPRPPSSLGALPGSRSPTHSASRPRIPTCIYTRLPSSAGVEDSWVSALFVDRLEGRFEGD